MDIDTYGEFMQLKKAIGELTEALNTMNERIGDIENVLVQALELEDEETKDETEQDTEKEHNPVQETETTTNVERETTTYTPR